MITLKDDVISRQAALNRFEPWLKVKGYSDGELNMLKAVLCELREMPSAQPGWIPCGERLPYAEYGESDTVLTTCGYRDVEDTSIRWTRLLYFNGGNWCYPTGETYEAEVYAWMPLPKPWEGGQDG